MVYFHRNGGLVRTANWTMNEMYSNALYSPDDPIVIYIRVERSDWINRALARIYVRRDDCSDGVPSAYSKIIPRNWEQYPVEWELR